MLIINSPYKQEEIIKLLDKQTFQGVTFEFVEKLGMKLKFKVDGVQAKDAVQIAKSTIKKSEFGSVIYFQVTYE